MANVKTVLVDVEPREGAHPEVERARQLAAASGARVHLLLVAYEPELSPGALPSRRTLEEVRERWLAELSGWLDALAAGLSREGIQARAEVLWHSPRYHAVMSRADELQADVIVRPGRRESGLGRLLFGAADWDLVRRAVQPLWLVRKEVDLLRQGARVLVAVDPSHPREKHAGLDRRLLDAGSRIVNLFGGELHVFHAWRPPAVTAPPAAVHPTALPGLALSPELVAELRAHREEQLGRLADAFGVAPAHVHLVTGETKAAIQECVATLRIDVVLAGAVSRGRIERLLIGSTAERILGAVECDVVVVKPDAFPVPPR